MLEDSLQSSILIFGHFPSYRGQICLPEILPRFYAKWPNIKIELCNESSNTMEERLYNGELDIFIGVMYQDNPKLESSTRCV